MDARNPGQSEAASSYESQLVGSARRTMAQGLGPLGRQRYFVRNPRLGSRSPRRQLCNDRGVRFRIQNASAFAGCLCFLHDVTTGEEKERRTLEYVQGEHARDVV